MTMNFDDPSSAMDSADYHILSPRTRHDPLEYQDCIGSSIPDLDNERASLKLGFPHS